MATFRSPKNKGLLVKFSNRQRVRFENGQAQVDEEDVILRLLDFAERHPEFEISVDEDDLDPEEPEDDDLDDEPEDDDEEPADGDVGPLRSPITGGH